MPRHLASVTHLPPLLATISPASTAGWQAATELPLQLGTKVSPEPQTLTLNPLLYPIFWVIDESARFQLIDKE
jgi:hypothetical protein